MENLIISDIQVNPVKPFPNGLVAFASFVMNDQFYVGDVAIYRHSNGIDYRLVYPTRKLNNGRQVQIIFPLTREIGQVVHNKVVGKYLTMYETFETD